MTDPFLGELRLLSFAFPPRGWAFCEGQLLPIAQNQALFSLLGTTYGGDGRTNFALPDLRGRQAFHVGTDLTLGQTGGAESVTLGLQHVEALAAAGDQDTNRGSAGAVLARGGSYSGDAPTTTLGAAGSGQAHPNMPPYLVLSWAIALQGIFPSRN